MKHLQEMNTPDLEQLMTELSQEKRRTNARELKRITREQIQVLDELERRTVANIATYSDTAGGIVTSGDVSGRKINCPINCPDPETCPF